MSDFLSSLIDRTLGAEPLTSVSTPTLRPVLPSRFESPRVAAQLGSSGWGTALENDLDVTASRPETSTNVPNDGLALRRANPPRDDADFPTAQGPISFTPDIDSDEGNSTRRFSPEPNQTMTNAMSPSQPRGVNRFDMDDSSWLNRRVDNMAVQLQRLRGDDAPPLSNQPSSPPPVQEPSVTRATDIRSSREQSIDSDRLWVHRRINDMAVQLKRLRGDIAPPFSGHSSSLPPVQMPSGTKDDANPSAHDNSIDSNGQEHRRSLVTDLLGRDSQDDRLASLHPVPSIPSERESQPVADRPEFGQLDELLSLAGRAAMQPPPPRIHPEDLPALRQPAPERTINVTIGRVEVKATREPTPVRRPAPAQNSSVMTLDDYLKQRAAGGL